MQSFIAFVNAILIANSVLSSVCSLPTQPIGATLGVDVTTPEQSSTCYELYPFLHFTEVRSLREHAVDSEGKSCFPTPRQPVLAVMLDDADFENNYANLTAHICPTWPKTTQCIRSHLNSHKCNEENRKLVIDSKIVNGEIIIIELLCNPVRAQHFRNFWINSLKEGLWECLFGETNLELSDQCETELDGEGIRRRYQDLSIFFDCMKSGLGKCTNGDQVKELKLAGLWEEFNRALQDTHRAFWNY